MLSNPAPTDRAHQIGARVEAFVRDIVSTYERDPRRDSHGPTEELVVELRQRAREAGVLSPHILDDGAHLTQRETAYVLRKSGLSLLGPTAVNTAAPDEGNMFLLAKVATPVQKERFLRPLVEGFARSSFFMTEPAEDDGAGSDPSMLKTTCYLDGDDWVISGRKAFITGVLGAKVGIVMARGDAGATMFLVDLPNPAIRIERVLDTIDSYSAGGHSVLSIDGLRVPREHVLGEPGEAFRYAQLRLAPARLSHCMRWTGGAWRAQEIALDYACRRRAFGKTLIEHEGVGFMLAENLIDLKQAELMTDWCADVLDTGARGIVESSMTKVAVSEALMRVADRCVQVMGGTGVTQDTMVEALYRELRAFRIYDGPTEVHKWSLAKMLQKQAGRSL